MPADPIKIIGRFREGDTDRANWKTQWESCARFGAPRRLGAVGQRTDGDNRILPFLYNPIGIQCVQTLAAALHGMVMNPATKWLAIKLMDDALDETGPARHWTNGVSKRITSALQSPYTAFHPHANQFLEDMASLGSAVMYAGQQKTGHLFVRTYPIFECVICENEYGTVDTVMRDSEYTVRQGVHIWGKNCPKKILSLYDKGKYEKKFKVVHSVYPRADEDRDYSAKTPQHMPIASCYVSEDEQHLMEESGVEEMPYMVGRWWVASGEVHGRSPLMTALPDIKVANIAVRDIMTASEKAISPPLTVPHDALVGKVRSAANGITYLRGKAEIGQIPTSSNLPFAHEWLESLENKIRTTMFVDQVQFVGDFKMTATEVIQRQTERMRLLGPVLGRLETEFLNPFITRVFGIMSRSGAFEAADKSIQNAQLKIEYQSPLARAQKSQIAQGFQQVIGVLEPLAKLSPQMAEQLFGPIDVSKITPALFDWFGVDTDLLKSEDDQGADDQKQRLMQMIQQVPALAKAFKDAMGGLQGGTSAGKTAIEAGQLQNAGGGAPAPLALPPPGGGGGGQPPPGAGGQDLASLLGSVTGGASMGLPTAVGNPSQALAAYTGRPQ